MLLVWFGMENGWLLLGLILSAAVLHEAAHCIALRCWGGRIISVRITLLGANINADCSRMSYAGELTAVLAGPATNLVCGVILTFLADRLTDPGLYIAAGAHWILGICNLFPLRLLDGGRALELAVHWCFGSQSGGGFLAVIGLLAALGGGVFLLCAIWHSGGSLWLLPPAMALLCSAGAEFRRLF